MNSRRLIQSPAEAPARLSGANTACWPRAHYRKWFRQIARVAGIPDDVRNKDSRAVGARRLPLTSKQSRTTLTHFETKTRCAISAGAGRQSQRHAIASGRP